MKPKYGLVLTLCCAVAPIGAHAQDAVSKRVAAAFATPVAVMVGPATSKGVKVDSGCQSGDRQRVQTLVRRIAVEEGFDADLADAVAWAESDMGQNQGPSSAGALGILQLMPATATRFGVADRCDAAANIRAGIRYMKSLYDEFHDPLLMLAAYNAGEQNVYAASGIPVNGETAKYIVKILNRWKLANVVRSSSSPRSEAQPSAMADGSSDVEWQDGHVIDFGN
ncbi:MAG: lytic transglycosylase domain-containing protein [Mesorhizobium sp.]|nr:lytic transglycosylase domain-containing protein [Mesorhizobium sp.]MBN9244880.1 lytic transglycosylase domain-containing protein [Mesorhizobium sp.]